MSTLWAPINRILPFSCVDGPGNRFVIFFQGCNFSCLNCHNPYTINHCNNCGRCVPICTSSALNITEQGKVTWNESKCAQCDECIDFCPFKSSPKIIKMSVNDLIDKIREYKLFINGITVSGGESTLHLPFIIELFKQIKEDSNLCHLTCLVDSNGSLSERGWSKLIPYMDGAMIDLKAWAPDIHNNLTSRGNKRVIDSIKYLAKHDKVHEIRLLIIPDHTDLEDKKHAIIHFIKSLSQPNILIRLNAFNNHAAIGVASSWDNASKERIEVFASSLKEQLANKVFTPAYYI